MFRNFFLAFMLIAAARGEDGLCSAESDRRRGIRRYKDVAKCVYGGGSEVLEAVGDDLALERSGAG